MCIVGWCLLSCRSLVGSGSPSPKNGAKSWDRPSVDFDEFVGQVIAHRLGKYKQPRHPNHISQEDYKDLYKKSRRAIIDAERKVSSTCTYACHTVFHHYINSTTVLSP